MRSVYGKVFVASLEADAWRFAHTGVAKKEVRCCKSSIDTSDGHRMQHAAFAVLSLDTETCLPIKALRRGWTWQAKQHPRVSALQGVSPALGGTIGLFAIDGSANTTGPTRGRCPCMSPHQTHHSGLPLLDLLSIEN